MPRLATKGNGRAWKEVEKLEAAFFFLLVPCALEAQTVINTSCLIGDSPVREKR